MSNREFEYCPTCASELDTGFECLKCGIDWRAWAILCKHAIRGDECSECDEGLMIEGEQ
jgi:hypothetical protein